MAYILDKENFLKMLPKKIIKSFDFVKEMDDNFFAENKYKPNKSKIYGIKVSKENFELVPIKATKPGMKDIVIEGYKIRFILSGKKSKGRKGDAKTTKMQELCSLKIAENVFNNKNTSLKELVEIYPDLVEEKSWIESFIAQEKVFKEIKSKFKPTIFNRDGGFMDLISKLIRKFGITHKDSWNPADIWLLNQKSYNIFKKKDFVSIEEINNTMKDLFWSGDLVGISLKKTKKKASYELVNLDTNKKINPFMFLHGNLRLDLKNNKFINDELNFDLKHPQGIINAQVRMYPKKAKSNVQISYKMKGAKAEFGKVPASFRNTLYKEYTGLDFPKGKEMIDDVNDFLKNEKTFKKKFDTIKKAGYFDMGVNNFKDFKENMIGIFDSNPKEYILVEFNTKMQGFEIAYGLSLLNKNKLEEILSKWAYLSQKKGEEFGPFLKIF
jgi:hypothetical protein